MLCESVGAVRGEGINIFHGMDSDSPLFLKQQFNTWVALDQLESRFPHGPEDRASIEAYKQTARNQALWGQARLVRAPQGAAVRPTGAMGMARSANPAQRRRTRRRQDFQIGEAHDASFLLGIRPRQFRRRPQSLALGFSCSPAFARFIPEVLLVGVGTVLNRALLPQGVRKLVVGSGFGYGTLPDFSDPAEWDIRCVRGPLTAGKLGLDESLGIIDPAVMVADMPEFQNLPKNGGAIFVPHWESTVGGIWPIVCQAAGLGYVDPCGEAQVGHPGDRAGANWSSPNPCTRPSWPMRSACRGSRSAPRAASTASSGRIGRRPSVSTIGPRHVPISSRAEAITKGARFWGVEFDRPAFRNRAIRISADSTKAW